MIEMGECLFQLSAVSRIARRLEIVKHAGPRQIQAVALAFALDFLGFGLPAPTPSWGELIFQGMQNLYKWWLVFFPLGAMFVTLLLIVFIGESVREAFDPKEYSRLR